MPYTKQTIPPAVKNLPEHAQAIWVAAFNSAIEQYKDEEKAFAVAWAAVKNQYKQVGDKWVKKGSEPQFFAYPVDVDVFQEGKTSEIKIIPVGFWKHPVYGDIKITEDDISEFEKNFNQGVRNDLPITEGHAQGNETKPAIGWFKKLINKGRDGLWALVEWTERGRKLLEERAYKYFSPEFYTIYEDPETRKVLKNVLVGGALVNKPYFKGLPAIVLSEQILKKDMDIKEILAKNPDELTEEEKDFLKENKESLSEEELEKFGLKEPEEKPVEEEKPEEKPEEEKEASEKTTQKAVMLSEDTLRILERKAEQGARAMEELRRMKVSEFVSGLTFSEHNPEGVFYPKSSDKVVEFVLSLSDDQLKTFKEIVAEMPKIKLFGEIGDSSGVPMSDEKRFDELVKSKLEKDRNLTYREAVEQVSAENPELAKKIA